MTKEWHVNQTIKELWKWPVKKYLCRLTLPGCWRTFSKERNDLKLKKIYSRRTVSIKIKVLKCNKKISQTKITSLELRWSKKMKRQIFVWKVILAAKKLLLFLTISYSLPKFKRKFLHFENFGRRKLA